MEDSIEKDTFGCNNHISKVNVYFEGADNVSNYENKLRGEKDVEKLKIHAENIKQELSFMDAFSTVSHDLIQNKDCPSEVDITFKLKENKKRFTIGSTINKQGKIGFEASAFFPNLLGTLSTSKLTFETFGSNSREFHLNHFTPKIFSSEFNMTYNLSKSMVDYKSSSFIENSLGGSVRFSDRNRHHNISIESRIRDPPIDLQVKPEDELQCNNQSSMLNCSSVAQTIKNSVCYSWNRIKSSNGEHSKVSSSQSINKYIGPPFNVSSNTIEQLSLELAGFGGDVHFIKTQGFHNWNATISKAGVGFYFPKKLGLDFNLGFGILIPNFIHRKPLFKTALHDKFFLGGNSGVHYCLPGFAPRSVGPCTQIAKDISKSKTIDNGYGESSLGGDGFASMELRASHPVNLNSVGIDLRPNLQAYLSGATVLNKSDYLTGDRKTFMERFRQNIRASTGVGLSVPIGSANLSLLFSVPIRHQVTDTLEGFQFGVRMAYAPL
ncbi:sorting and assembly machinery component 50 isoform X1 [Cryptosporidium felis]|nr:sorting and assembly machinery component 50 isoform X1 [Cryptosporidium felis]